MIVKGKDGNKNRILPGSKTKRVPKKDLGKKLKKREVSLDIDTE